MRDRLQELGEAAWDALQRMVREVVRRKPGGHLIEHRLPEIELRLALSLDGRQADPAAFSRDLIQEIERQVDAAIEAAAAFQPGNAFCHRCGIAACEHSRPPSNRHVFIGYAATGLPFWREFAQHCLELRHPEVDRLFQEPPAFVTMLQGGAELHSALLPPFRTEGRDLLGQVIAGFFALPARPGEGRGVLALTIQAVASRGAGGRAADRRPRLIGLNLLGAAPGGGDLGLLWERQDDLPWRRAVRWAQASLASVARELQPRTRGKAASPAGAVAARDARLERRVLGILQGLARRLEQDVKGRARRTAHASERHEDGARPTRKALDDVREARPEAFLVDARSGAVVVLGDRGRTHFLTLNGRLVSSARYSRDAIDRKLRQGLWRELDPETARSVRQQALKDAAPAEPVG